MFIVTDFHTLVVCQHHVQQQNSKYLFLYIQIHWVMMDKDQDKILKSQDAIKNLITAALGAKLFL